MQELKALQRAIAVLGSQAALARIVGVRQPSVWRALRVARRASAEWCVPIERATKGIVTRHELRPDLYPEQAQIREAAE